MIQRLRLTNYRSFRDFFISFSGSGCLVGPNNAGKSTILTALRLADALLRVAHARKPSVRQVRRNAGYNCYPISMAEFPSLRESLRHEFHGDEASLELTWRGGNKLVAFWPELEGGDPPSGPRGYFYLQKADKQQPKSVPETRVSFPRLGIVPILMPIEHTEAVLSEDYVKGNVSSRLSSRHFRNQLLILEKDGKLDEFKQFAEPWLPGIEITRLDAYESDGDDLVVDLYLQEIGSRIPKEAIWAGDGIQIWLQILYHVFRLQSYDTIILDEPDVYLHADLQRRLVQLLESTRKQTIIATHSAEIAAETPRSQIVWVDKSRRSAVAIKDEGLLEQLTETLGTSFNLKLAKAMRSKVLLLVEGKDMQLLRRISETLGADRISRQDGVSVVSMLGYSRNSQVAPFKWILDDLLQNSVECFAVFDRDYRPVTAASALESQLRAVGVEAHVWKRKELESYLIHPEAIARISGASPSVVGKILDEEAALMEGPVFSKMLEEEIALHVSAKRHRVDITTIFKAQFDSQWANKEWRLDVVPPKDLIKALNRRLQALKLRTVSSEKLAASLLREEIPAEMRGVLLKVERAVRNHL